jgi:dCMP deaminase
MKDKHLRAYMDTAIRFSECSTAERLKVGCIAVKDNKIISIGYNGTPNGCSSGVCEDGNNRTLPYVVHAEMNMISKLAKGTESSEGCSVFITHSPCMECAKLMYQSGISKVYYNKEYRDTSGIDFLREYGIEVIHLSSRESLDS